MEAALAYQTIVTGQVFDGIDESQQNAVPVIKKILDRTGEVIWEYKPEATTILSKRVSLMISEILRHVMNYGTGRKARDAVQLLFSVDDEMVGFPLPCFGKTGTTNRFTNSSFVGFIPGPQDGSRRLDMKEAYVIATYLGYDDNRPMKSEHHVIYGASGALPLWVDTANAIVNRPSYRRDLEPADLVFDPVSALFSNLQEYRKIAVSPVSGLPVSSWVKEATLPRSLPELMANVNESEGTLKLKRYFEPIGRTEK
jgi:membrane peptidoglycan carboxypeptidase